MTHRLPVVTSPKRGSLRVTLRAAIAVVLAVAVMDWIGLRQNAWSHSSSLLAFAAAVVLALSLIELVASLVEVRSVVASSRLLVIARVLVLAGIAVALVAGGYNWARRVQGYVILTEGESAVLRGGTQLQQFEQGPLAQLEELDIALSLVKVELSPAGRDLFFPESRFLVIRGDGSHVARAVAPKRPTSAGNLRLYQGAFGFAPRIVLARGTETLFDRTVPFLTERREAGGVVFEGDFTVEREKLHVKGGIDLSTVDESMSGHALLHLRVSKNGVALGEGALLPGHFAAISGDYRIGFAGLKKWSEIDVSRKNYPAPLFTGALMSVAGLLLWPFGIFLRRRG